MEMSFAMGESLTVYSSQSLINTVITEFQAEHTHTHTHTLNSVHDASGMNAAAMNPYTHEVLL